MDTLSELDHAIDGLGEIKSEQKILKKQLIELGQDAKSYRDNESIKNPSAITTELKSIERSIEGTIASFGLDNPKTDLEQAFSSTRAITLSITNYANVIRPERYKHWPLENKFCREKLTELFKDLRVLKSAVKKSIEEIDDRIKEGRGGNRHAQNWVRDEITGHLLRIYFEETGKEPGVSNPPGGGKPYGPAFKFVDSCLKAFGFEVKPSTAANLINKLKKDPDLPWNLPADP